MNPQDPHRSHDPSPAARALGLPAGRWADVCGPVHYLEWEGPAGGPTFVLVHGLGGSHLNWVLVAPGLARHGRVLAPDLVGHGHTPVAGRRASIAGQWRLLDGFLRAMDLPPVVLVGNSMGGMLALIEAAHAPEAVDRLVLTNAAFPRPPRWAGRLSLRIAAGFLISGSSLLGPEAMSFWERRLGPDGMLRETFETIAADPRAIDPAVVALEADLLAARIGSREAELAVSTATRSIVRAHLRPWRYRELVRRVGTPALVLHGGVDRLVPRVVAELAVQGHEDWSLEVYPDLGHVPQLEAPDRWLGSVSAWLATAGRARG